MSKKIVWIINQYAATPNEGIGGRSYYFSESLSSIDVEVYLISASYTHLLRKPPKINKSIELIKLKENFNFVWLKVPSYTESHSKQRIINWFIFAAKILKLKSLLPKPDVVIYSSPSLVGYLGAERVAKDMDVPLVFEVRDIWPLTLIELGNYSINHPFIKFLQYIEDRAYRNADIVVSNLKNAVEHMQSRGMDKVKFNWIPNGFLKQEVENANSLEQSTLNQLPKNKFVIGYAGTFGLANALESYINAAKILKDYEDIAFVLVGQGKLKEKLVEQVDKLNLSNVYFVDSIPKSQIQSLLKQFDVCYIGLTKDPLFRFGVSPNKLFDYLYAGKPIIYAIDSGKYTPILDAGAGIQVEPENEKQISEAVLELYHLSPGEREEMGNKGKNTALNSYEYNSLAKKLMNIIFENNKAIF